MAQKRSKKKAPASGKTKREDSQGGTKVTFPDRKLFERVPERQPEHDGKRRSIEPGKWSREIGSWLKRREKKREPQKDPDRQTQLPRPWLDCTSNFGPFILPLRVGQPGTVAFTVWNDGLVPAWTCYIAVYEGPGGYSHQLSDYELRGRTITTLHPGERREISLPWVRKQKTGRIVGIVYDPLLDPKDFTLVEHFNRHITSVHYFNLP